MTNLQEAKKLLAKQYPDDAKIKDCDKYYVCNKYLSGNRARNDFAKKLGFDSECDICCDNCDGADGMARYSKRCRDGVLRWLEAEG